MRLVCEKFAADGFRLVRTESDGTEPEVVREHANGKRVRRVSALVTANFDDNPAGLRDALEAIEQLRDHLTASAKER
jgi:hypothetical protein